MDVSLRVAVVGTGFVGPHHIDAARRTGDADVVLIVGTNRERTAARADALGVARHSTDLADALADDIDVVHVCTPNRSHVEIGLAALGAGKHVVIEKPVALDGDSGERLAAEARRRGLHGLVAFTYRGYPMVRRARALVAGGELGAARLIHGAYLQDWLAYESDFNWRVIEAEGGASRAVADIGSHWFDTAEFVSGERVSAVFADFSRFIDTRNRPGPGVETFAAAGPGGEPVAITTEDAATILVRFVGGARGSCVVSQVSHGHKNSLSLEVTGADRTIAWHQETPEQLWLASRDSAQTLQRDAVPVERGVPSLPAGHPEGWSEALRDLLRPFYAAIAAGRAPAADGSADYPTLGDGVRAVRFVEAALQSSREARWVEVG